MLYVIVFLGQAIKVILHIQKTMTYGNVNEVSDGSFDII